MAVFTSYSGNTANLVTSLLANSSGISIVSGSEQLNPSALGAVNFYDGSLTPLGIGDGLLITSGTAPGTSNTVGWFGADNTQYDVNSPLNFDNGSALIDAVVNTVFQTKSYDATTLAFDFTVTDPSATSISFDIVFGSDEYPEWVDQFVDCAVVVVNGVNYALFNHDPNAPLSVVSPNLAAGYFQDNSSGLLPIEYDGLSHMLKIVAPIFADQKNSITIGIADTGDHIYDSGIFIANMKAGTIPGSGVVITPDVPCTNNDDLVTGTVADELINLLGGDDTAYAGGGDDIIVAGAGNDAVYAGSGNDTLEGDSGNDFLDGGDGITNTAVYSGSSIDYSLIYDNALGQFTVTDKRSGSLNEGVDALTHIQLVKFSNGLYSLDATTNSFIKYVDAGGGADNALGSVVISGAAMVGQTLSAIVIDADGVPASGISYDWQTSSDGLNWTSSGIATQAYVVPEGAGGLSLQVLVSYTDAAGYQEVPLSSQVTVGTAKGLSISLINLSSPDGAGVANPLTTLLNNAIVLGFSANEAALAIKTVFGLSDISLKTYDPVAYINSHPDDTTSSNFKTALSVLKICGELAMAASASDPTGFNLTLAVMNAAAQEQTINLASATQLDILLAGVGSTELGIVKTCNKDMADATSVGDVMLAWNDFCGNTDGMEQYKSNFSYFDKDLNQAPVGFSSAKLAYGDVDVLYTINASDLLAGFSDPDNDMLHIDSLVASNGGALIDNLDGTWTFSPDSGFSGPVELAFTVSDPFGQMVNGNSMFVIASGAALDVTPPTVTMSNSAGAIANGDVTYTLNFSENVTELEAVDFSVTNGVIKSIDLINGSQANYAVVVTPTSGYEGDLGLSLNSGAVSDEAGNTCALSAATPQVVDTKAPTVLSFSPADGQALVSVTSNVVLTFSEPISLGFGTISIFQGSATGTLFESFDLASSNRLSVSGNTLTIDPINKFVNNTSYLVVFNAAAVTDIAVNPYAGTNTYDFVTIPLGNVINGTNNADTLTGTKGVDIISGLGGNDVITGGAGADKQDGGDGSDIYMIAAVADYATGEIIADTGAAGTDELRFAATAASTLVLGSSLSGVEKVVVGTGTSTNAVTTAATAINVDANAVTYGITLIGNAGANILKGGSSNDILAGGAGKDTFNVTAGTDAVTDLGNGGADVLNLLAGATANATVTAAWTASASTVNRGIGNINTAGLAVNLAAVTTAGTNGFNVTNTSATATTLTGSSLEDTLKGNAGADTLSGGSGNDTLNGGKGADKLKGGAGSDTFIFTLGDSGQLTTTLDVVNDYAKGVSGIGDRFDFSANLVIGGSNAAATITQASINSATGVASFAASSGTSLTDALSDIATRFTAAGDGAGEFAFFKVGSAGAYYLFISDGTAGVTLNDVVVQLVGVTAISNVDLMGGDLTILA